MIERPWHSICQQLWVHGWIDNEEGAWNHPLLLLPPQKNLTIDQALALQIEWEEESE